MFDNLDEKIASALSFMNDNAKLKKALFVMIALYVVTGIFLFMTIRAKIDYYTQLTTQKEEVKRKEQENIKLQEQVVLFNDSAKVEHTHFLSLQKSYDSLILANRRSETNYKLLIKKYNEKRDSVIHLSTDESIGFFSRWVSEKDSL